MSALFATDFPLIQAPMAGVQDWRLAAAVCEAGGLGSVPAGMLSAQGLEEPGVHRPKQSHRFLPRTSERFARR
ncbi:MAG: hypothetical protein GY824_30225, partial [Delftia sp.]|nr:hypothetical protein [Delftia sp.]